MNKNRKNINQKQENIYEKNIMKKWQNLSNDEKVKRFIILNQKKDKLSLDEYKEWEQLHDWYGDYLVNKDLKEQKQNNKKGNK